MCVIALITTIASAACMNKVMLMETGETPSLGPSRCFASLILSFALRLANLYEVPLLKCEGDGKGLQALFAFLH